MTSSITHAAVRVCWTLEKSIVRCSLCLLLFSVPAQAQSDLTTNNAPDAPLIFRQDLPDHAVFRIGSDVFRPGSNVTDLAASPDGKYLVSMGADLCVWDTASGKQLWSENLYEHGIRGSGYAFGGKAVAFGPDSEFFFTPGRENEFVRWEVNTGDKATVTIQDGFAHEVPVQREETPEVLSNGLPTKTPKSIDISPDGKIIALSSSLGVLFSDQSGRVLHKIANRPTKIIYGEGPEFADRLTYMGHYCDARFSSQAGAISLIRSESPQTVEILDAEDFAPLQTVVLDAWIVRQSFVPDGTSIALTDSAGGVRSFDVRDGKERWSFQMDLKNLFENYAAALCFSADGNYLAAGATDKAVYLLDTEDGQLLHRVEPHDWSKFALEFSPDSKILYSAGNVIFRWTIPQGEPMDLPSEYHATGVAAASPNGSLMAFGDARKFIRVIDTATLQEIGRITVHADALKFSTNGALLAAGGQQGDQIWVGVWDTADFTRQHFWQWPMGADLYTTINDLSFNTDATRLAAASFRQNKVFLWNLQADEEIAVLSHKTPYGVSFSPISPVLVSGGWDEHVRFWDASSGQSLDAINVREATQEDRWQAIYHISCSPDGRLVAAGHGLNISLFDMASHELRNTFRHHRSGGWGTGDMSFSPDGLWLSSTDMSRILKIWDPYSGHRVMDVGIHGSDTAEFSQRGRRLLSGGEDGYCYLWNLVPRGAAETSVDLDELWNALVGDDAAEAYTAYWQLADMQDAAVDLLDVKLRSVSRVFDIHAVSRGLSEQQVSRRQELVERILRQDETSLRLASVRRAVRLLARIGTPNAIHALEFTANSAPADLLRSEAEMALLLGKQFSEWTPQ